MEVIMTIVNIVLMVLFLSILVCLHELGHLAVAKMCNVYCYEYSIGFGKALFKHRFLHRDKKLKKKYKNSKPLYRALVKGVDGTPGETEYSIRLIPLGGYVAMAGEEEDVDDLPLVKVPKERTLTGVNHFKQICIMLAGIAVNFLVAYVLFFVAYSCFDQTYIDYTTNQVSISEENNPLYDEGLRTGDYILSIYQDYENVKTKEGNDVSFFTFPLIENRVAMESFVSYKDDATGAAFDDLDISCINYAAANLTSNDIEVEINGVKTTLVATENSRRTLHITYSSSKDGTDPKNIEIVLETEAQKDGSYNYQSFDLSPWSYQFRLTPLEALETANRQFSSMFVGIYQALGQLFTPSGWQNVGGIVSIYRISTSAIQSGSGTYFFSLWAYISLNLGCFNLVPLPPLDGFNVLIALGETVTRKKCSAKVKGIFGLIGTVLLIALAVLLVIKDIIFPL